MSTLQSFFSHHAVSLVRLKRRRGRRILLRHFPQLTQARRVQEHDGYAQRPEREWCSPSPSSLTACGSPRSTAARYSNSLRPFRSSCAATRSRKWTTTGRSSPPGGSESQCGWLKDKFGLCWQIVPARMSELLKHPKAMQAMMKMKKLDIAELERAAKE